MAEKGPLDQPRLRVIEQRIDAGDLDEAQRLLANLGESSELGPATSYLATRILFRRGRLTTEEVAERLRDLMAPDLEFPEAQRLLEHAESGRLDEGDPDAVTANSIPASSGASTRPPRSTGSSPSIAVETADAGDLDEAWGDSLPEETDWLVPSEPLRSPDGAGEKDPVRKAKAAVGSAWPSIPELETPMTSQPPESVHDRPTMVTDSDTAAMLVQAMATGSPEPAQVVRGLPSSDTAQNQTEANDESVEVDRGAEPSTTSNRSQGAAHRPASSWPPLPTVPSDVPSPLVRSASPLPSAKPVPRVKTPLQDFGADRQAMAPDGPTEGEPVARGPNPDIPAAPPIPYFSPPLDRSPSYAPDVRGHRSVQSPEDKTGSDRPTVRPLSVRSPQPAAPVEMRSGHMPPDFDFESEEERVSGRYSGTASSPEIVWKRFDSRSPNGGPARSDAGKSEHPRPSHPAKRNRSSLPAAESQTSAVPSLAQLGQMLEVEKYASVLEAIGPDRTTLGPEYTLLLARALAGLDRRDEAQTVLGRFGSAPLLDPDLRAAGAQLLIELGACEAAFEQTSRAFAEAPDAPAVRMAHAWAALRLARRRDQKAMAHTAETALAGQKSRSVADPGALVALRACVQAHVGDPERAVSTAQRALSMAGSPSDAWAAIAIASARLRRPHDARQAWLRLHQAAADEAGAIAPTLAEFGVQISAVEASAPVPVASTAKDIWDPVELALLDQRTEEAIEDFEQTCREHLSELAEQTDQSFSAIAARAATVLTRAPVWRFFAPYDLSLWSVARTDAALRVLYGQRPLERSDADNFPVSVLVGSYLGEVLCLTHGARWEGSVMDIEHVRVQSSDSRWSPLRLVEKFLHERSEVKFDLPSSTRSAHPGSDPWCRHRPPTIAPPCPWEPDRWPHPDLLTKLGRALSSSVLSRHCEQRSGSPLDGSIASLSGLDQYLALLSPTMLRATPGAPWLPRVGVLVGSYVGEVLRKARGAEWIDTDSTPRSAESYRLRLPGGSEAQPVAQVLDRLTGKNLTPLHDYAVRLAE